MKKIINIVFKIPFLLLFIGIFSSHSYAQTYLQIGENSTTYTADPNTNHIWTMSKTGGVFNDIDITVSLEKGIFKINGGGNFGYGTGAGIPADWDFEITTVKTSSNEDVGFVGKVITFTDNPIETITATIRVFDGNGTVNNLSAVQITYYLISPFTAQNVAFNSCTQSQIINLDEVSLQGAKPCANYNLKVFNAGTIDLATPEIVQTTPNFSLVLPVGNYEYVVTDGCGRSINATFSILEIAELGTSVIFAGKQCASDSDGVAVLKLAGAAKPLTWVLTKDSDLDDVFETDVYTNLNAGNYSIDGDSDAFDVANYTITIPNLSTGTYKFTFTDKNGCIKEKEFTINAATALNHELLDKETTVQALLCNGDANGQLTFRGFGGWTQPFAGNPFNPTNWGSKYTFTLINKADPTTPINPSNPIFSFDENNDRNGWEAIFSNLPPGIYQLKLKETVALNTDADPDAELGCEVLFPDEYIISAPAAISVDVTENDISCAGDSDGNVSLVISGGTPFAADHPLYPNTFKVTWNTLDGSGLIVTDKDQTGLGPGTYNVNIEDANGCSASDSFEISQNAELLVSIDDPVAIDCYADNVGKIKANITQESASPYTYTLTGTDFNNDAVSQTVTDKTETTWEFTGLKAGTNYKVTITDANGCSKTTDDKSITQPASGMTFDSVVMSGDDDAFNGYQISCNDGNDGSIALTITGGTPGAGYKYTWTTTSGSGLDTSTDSITSQTGLTAGNYSVTVEDSTGCSITRNFTLNDPGPLNITAIDMPADLKAGYTYLGENGNSKYYRYNSSRTWLESRDISSAAKGYLVAVDSAEENQWLVDNAIDNIWIGYNDIETEGTFKWINGSSSNVYNNWNTGEPNNASGNEHYTELLSGAAAGKWNDLPNTVAKQFVVEYTTNGTTISSYSGGFNISCFGANDGKITLMPTGGVLKADGTYTYEWTKTGDAGYSATTKDIENLGPGTYNVKVIDRNNCEVQGSFTLTEPPQLAGSLDNTISTTINCFNEEGTIKVDIDSQSVAPYSYQFTGEDYLTNEINVLFTNQTDLTKSLNVKAGTYQVKIIDANGCFITTANKTFTQPAQAVNVKNIVVKKYVQYGDGVANEVNISCNGVNDGEITFNVDGGTPNDDGSYNYAWEIVSGGVGTGLDADGGSPQTGLTAGEYRLTVSDKTGTCTVVEIFDIKEPVALDIIETESDFNGKNISCFGASDGSITLDITGGTKFASDDVTNPDSYDFQWVASNGGALEANKLKAQNQTDLGPGTYQVTVTDANDCSEVESYVIDQPDALALSFSFSNFNGSNVSCSGAVDGTINVTVSGGTPKSDTTYTYAWSTSNGSGLDPTSKDQSGLGEGTYKLIVTDNNGCTIEKDDITIDSPPAIIVTATLKDFEGFNISCKGEDDGEIDVLAEGGFRATVDNVINDYTYAWSTIDGSGLDPAVADQTGLTAGTYSLKVTDDNGCEKITDYVIAEPTEIGFSGVTSNYNNFQISISGLTDGTITISPLGGTPDVDGNYTYQWNTADGSGLVAGQQNQTNLSKGTYTLKLIDSNGCNISKDFTLIEPNELIIALGTDPTNILCHGDSTGLFKAIITTGSVAPYTYTLKGTDYNGVAVEEVTAAKNDLNHTFNVTAGTYTITVEDINGAKKESASRIFTHPAAALAISETISLFRNDVFNISCNGASDGKIEAVASGGTLNGGAYDYTWSTSNGTTILNPKEKTQSGLGPGDYKLSVKDQNLCIIEKTYTLTEPEPIFYQVVSKKDITCFGDNDGSIEISVRKGTGIYTYLWSTVDGSGLAIGETTNPEGLGPGTYKLDLSDGCETLSFTYEIVEPKLLSITLDEKLNILCHGDTTGKILVTIEGGTIPYTYEWIDNLGNKYNRDIGNVFNKGNLSNIPFGIYSLTVTDKNGCVETLNNVELTQPDDLVIDFVKTDLNCFGVNDGTITVTPSGGIAPYSYQWSDFGNGAIRENLAAGTYNVKVIDDNLCEESIDIIIKQAPLFNIVPVVTPVTCFGANDGTISLNMDGGNSPITVKWADDATAGVDRTNLKPGNYNVVITDGTGCVIDEIFQILEPIELTLSANITDALDCDNPLSGSIDLQVIGGNSPYTFLWSSGQTTEDITAIGANNYSVKVTDSKGCIVEKDFVIKRQFELNIDLETSLRIVCDSREVYQVNKVTITGGVFPYTVKWSDGDVLGNGESMETKDEGAYQVEVTDNLGCTKTILFDVILPKLGFPDFDYTSFYLQTFNALTFGDLITFTNLSTENFLSIEWDFGDGTTSKENNPTHTYVKSGSYDVTIIVEYIGGCFYTLTKTLFIGDSYELELPNAFTPNSDGLNDTFRPVYYGLTEVNMKVFDTWGTLIYYEKADKNKLNGWDGRINGKLAENGNYIYQVAGKAFNGELVYKNGPFTLLR